jgi:hypothetical protein
MSGQRAAHRLIRAGVAFAFLYPSVGAFLDPNSWVGYIILQIFSIFQVIVALWILSGWRIRIPAVLATLTLLAVVGVNWVLMNDLFRDIAIAAMTLALVLWPSVDAVLSQNPKMTS